MNLTAEKVERWQKLLRAARRQERSGNYHNAQLLLGAVMVGIEPIWHLLKDEAIESGQYDKRIDEILSSTKYD